MRLVALSALGLVATLLLSVAPLVPVGLGTDVARGTVGFDWGNAAKVYILHWDQRSVLASDPSAVFRVAKENGVHVMRCFLGSREVYQRWLSDPAGMKADAQRLFNDAAANGVAEMVSHDVGHHAIEVLAGKTYPDWATAQRDLVTTGTSAHDNFLRFLADMASTFGQNPGLYSMEVVNEPTWQLGSDAGHISNDQLVAFLNEGFKLLKEHGAKRTNMGGSKLAWATDDQLRQAYQYVDLADDHFYPDYDAVGNPVDGNVARRFQGMEDLLARLQRVMGRTFPAMLGEMGTLPRPWFTSVVDGALSRGWTALAWEYDGWDQFWFSTAYRPEVLDYLRTSNVVPDLAVALGVAPGTSPVGTVPLAVGLQALVSGGVPPYAYAWDFGDGATSTDANPNHTYTAPGNYTVQLTVVDASNQTARAEGYITVAQPLSVGIVAKPPTGATPLVVEFNATPSGGFPPYAIHWTFGDGTASDLQGVNHTYASPGVYHVHLMVTDSAVDRGGIQNVTAVAGGVVSVVPTLVVLAQADPTVGVAPIGVNFTAVALGGSPPYDYAWDFGDGATGVGGNVSHGYQAPGAYNATLTVTDSVGTYRTAAVAVSVAAPLALAASPAAARGAPPLDLQFHSSAEGGRGPYSFHWDFGDGSSATQQNPTHVFNQPGSYTVRVEVRDGSGQAVSRTLQITVEGGTTSFASPLPPALGLGAAALVAIAALAVLHHRRPRRDKGP